MLPHVTIQLPISVSCNVLSFHKDSTDMLLFFFVFFSLLIHRTGMVESVEVAGSSRRRTEDSKRSKRQLLFSISVVMYNFEPLSLSPQPSTQLAPPPPPSESIFSLYTLTLSFSKHGLHYGQEEWALAFLWGTRKHLIVLSDMSHLITVLQLVLYNRDFPENHILLFTIVNPVYPITVVSWPS